VRKLLIVDDDAHLRTLVRTYAELDGWQCFEAGSGDQALCAAEADAFDIIVLDVMMPGRDGFETLSELLRSADTPVLMLTARKEEYDKLFGFRLGADDYLAKPFSPKELMARLNAILRRGRRAAGEALRFGGLVRYARTPAPSPLRAGRRR